MTDNKRLKINPNDRRALVGALRDARRRNDYKLERKITMPLERAMMREADEEWTNWRHHVEQGSMSTADFFKLFKPKYMAVESNNLSGDPNWVESNEHKDVLYKMYTNGKIEEDVLWCGTGKEVCTWAEFAKLIKNIHTKMAGEGYMIVGQDWWINKVWEPGSMAFELEWSFHSVPRQQEKTKKLTKITLFDMDDYG